MTVVWLKFIHVAAVAVWTAGLIGLPGLYLQRARTTERRQLYRLQELVRFFYISLISPSAFVAIATGIGLIFVAGTFDPWFTAKLYLVGGFVALHILTGLVIIRLFDEEGVYPLWRFVTVTCVTLLFVVAIVFVVLFKPPMNVFQLPQIFGEPGGLGRLADDLIGRALR